MSGKAYNGEKAVISLTSWKKRIGTVGITLFSLLRQCPGFHIVLVLSEEEFPNKEAELPSDLVAFVNSKKIEILWVYKNTKAFKKVIPTMRQYPSVPIISADDDCIYTSNYAQKLYDAWLKNPTLPIMYRKSMFPYCLCGPASLYPPVYFNDLIELYDKNEFNNSVQDDKFIMEFFANKKIQGISLTNVFPCYFHDEICPLTGSDNVPAWKSAQSF